MLARSVIHEMVGPLIAAVLAVVCLQAYDTSKFNFFEAAQLDGSIEMTGTVDSEETATESSEVAPMAKAKPIAGTTLTEMKVTFGHSFAEEAKQFRIELPVDPNLRLASLTQPQKLPSVVVKPQQPKQPPRKITWDELTNGKERRNFIIRYIKSHGFVCPKSGKTDAQEEEELQTYYPWGLVVGYIQGHCPLKGQQASAPLG